MRVGESREIKIFVDVSNLKLGFPVSVMGAHFVTVPPPKFFCQQVAHTKTEEAVQQFITDFQRWLE